MTVFDVIGFFLVNAFMFAVNAAVIVVVGLLVLVLIRKALNRIFDIEVNLL